MKQYRKRILIILGVLSLLVITGSCFFLLLKPSQKPKELEYLMGTAMGKSDFQLFGDQNQYVLAPRNKGSLYVSKSYAITDEYKFFLEEDKNNIPHHQREGEYWNLVLYNLYEKGLPERKIDLYQAVRSYNQKSIPRDLFDSYYVEDTHYFGIEIVDLTDEKNWSYKTVYLNLETEEVVDLPKDTKFEMDSIISSTVRATNYGKILDSKGYIDPSNEIQLGLKGRSQTLTSTSTVFIQTSKINSSIRIGRFMSVQIRLHRMSGLTPCYTGSPPREKTS